MKNPITLKLKNGEPYSCGDPFILRFNGKYYLYPSCEIDDEGIRVFISDDLVNYQEYGYVVKNPILKNAYAPEVIYHDGVFYMCTSPGGNGHYFLKSSSPTGPFSLISENLHSMIDGSFVHDKDFNLKFIRADHNGICMLDFDEDKVKLTNRKYILPQISRGWTEGPSIFYRYPYYYATYCGNFLVSTAYRVKYATSLNIDDDYHVADEPLIISTKKNYSALGHNSVVLGPNLDQYYAAYHVLENKKNRVFRYLGIDNIYFNGRMMAVNPSNMIKPKPPRPLIEDDLEHSMNNFYLEKDLVLSKLSTDEAFTAEFNFKGENKIIIKNQNEKFTLIDYSKKGLSIYDDNGQKIFFKALSMNCLNFHTIRIVNADNLLIYFDNVYIGGCNKIKKGKIGYVYKQNLYYTAFTNHVNGSSNSKMRINIPGNLLINEMDINKIDNKEYYVTLSKPLNFYLKSSSTKYYYLFGNIDVLEDVEMLINSKSDSQVVIIHQEDNEYTFRNRFLCKLLIEKDDHLTITLIKGKIKIKNLLVKELIDNERLIKNIVKIDKRYIFTHPSKIASIDFVIKKFDDNSLFGLIFNASNYSTHSSNQHPRFMGYIVGLRNDLLVVEHCQYETQRVYDKPIPIKVNEKYTLKMKINDDVINVFINDELMFVTTLPYQDTMGLSGIYNAKNVILSNYIQEDFYE